LSIHHEQKKSSFEGDSKAVQKILELSDAEFEKWMDSVEKAGIRLKTKA